MSLTSKFDTNARLYGYTGKLDGLSQKQQARLRSDRGKAKRRKVTSKPGHEPGPVLLMVPATGFLAVVPIEKIMRERKAQSKAQRKPKRPRPSALPKLTVPEGVHRYYLSVPRGRETDAQNASCQYDQHSKRWYVDNPPNLADFAAWKPSRVGFAKLAKQLKKHHQAAEQTVA